MALKGVRVIEMAGLAPVPYCAQVLRDFGADVIRVDRAGATFNPDNQSRGKMSIGLNMKEKQGQNILQSLVEKSDVILDPFRPGVLERLNCGPDDLMAKNSRLIFARLSGFGQNGPLSKAPGHDINYIAQSGVLDSFRDSNGRPTPPVNIAADFAGGGLLLSTGIMAALFERETSGKGQVLDLAMSEGSAYAAGFLWAMRNRLFPNQPGKNMLDGGAPFYRCYKTKDNRWMALGAIEPQFYADFISRFGIEIEISEQMDPSTWPKTEKLFEERFSEKSLSEWTEIYTDSQACCTPVLTPDEAQNDSHNLARNAFLEDSEGEMFPVPVPFFSRSKISAPLDRPQIGGDTKKVLSEILGQSKNNIDQLISDGIVS